MFAELKIGGRVRQFGEEREGRGEVSLHEVRVEEAVITDAREGASGEVGVTELHRVFETDVVEQEQADPYHQAGRAEPGEFSPPLAGGQGPIRRPK